MGLHIPYARKTELSLLPFTQREIHLLFNRYDQQYEMLSYFNFWNEDAVFRFDLLYSQTTICCSLSMGVLTAC